MKFLLPSENCQHQARYNHVCRQVFNTVKCAYAMCPLYTFKN